MLNFFVYLKYKSAVSFLRFCGTFLAVNIVITFKFLLKKRKLQGITILNHHRHHHYRFSRIRPLGLFRLRIYFLELMNLCGHLVGLLGRGISPTQGLYLHTEQHNTEKRGHTSMPRVGFESMIPVFEQPKTVRASDRLATGTGQLP
jgi:hypothetical protein